MPHTPLVPLLLATTLFIGTAASTAVAQEHPRIFFTNTDIPQLQNNATTTHTNIATQLQTFADQMVQNQATPPTDPIAEFPEEGTWRIWGEQLPAVAMAWLIETNPTKRDAYHQWLTTWMDAMAGWPQWGPTPRTHLDLDGAHLLAGFTTACDIIDSSLDSTRRTQYHNRIATQANAFADAVTHADPPFWTNNWLGNHNTINHNAVLLAGLMLQNEHGDANTWITLATTNTQHVMDLRQSRTDGSDIEGVMYATYGDHSLFQTLHLLHQHLDIDHSTSPWITARANFYLHSTHPNLDTTLDIGDCLGTWGHGPEHNLFYLDTIAPPTEQGRATALALAIRDAMTDTHPLGKPPGATLWLSFLWFNPQLADTEFPAQGPELTRFDDWDVVVWKEGWDHQTQLPNTTLSFKCGTSPGRSAWNAMLENNDLIDTLGCAHANPDAGSFTFKPHGQHFIIDSLYERPKRTSLNNCITFGPPPIIDRGIDEDDLATVWDLAYFDQLGDLAEIGQTGEWNVWMGPMHTFFNQDNNPDPTHTPHINAHGEHNGVIYTSGEAHTAYPHTIPIADGATQALGLQRLHRGLLRLPNDVLLVIDRIATNNTLPTHTYFRSLSTPAFDRDFQSAGDGNATATLLLDDGSTGVLQVLTPFTGALTTGRTICDWDDVHPALHVDDWHDLNHWSIFARFTNPDQDGDTTTVYALHDNQTTANVTSIDTSDARGVQLTIELDAGMCDIRIATDLTLESRLGFLGINGYATSRGALYANICSGDANGGGCPCIGDADDSGSVDIEDLLLVLGEYSTCTENCSGDLDDDGDVDIEDMLIVIGGWGPCP